ncbi:DUF2207 domain-containing protein [Neofamilia massiliensis]|uniref:DUF2207 domain-containing protein n=1 Tax=Neofamilia massiliensis TaxID=1673724 RepID=UPI0006BB968D|nr:DUF2207 domain-containing protein [Neofamilia massiliensis]
MKFFKDKKKYLLGLLILSLCILIVNPVFAKESYGENLFENEGTYGIQEIKTLADIDSDGTMTLKQRWVFNDSGSSGTEHYIVFDKGSLKGAKLKDFQVYQDGVLLEEIPWDIDASFEEKVGKFGINETADSLELCFGIGKRVDENVFEVTYKVENIMEKTSDGAFFLHWKFINDSLSDLVGKARLDLSFPNEVKKIFAFGYDGIVAMADDEENTVIFENAKDQPLDANNYLVALVEVNGPFNAYRDLDFTRDDLYEEAFAGSSYNLADLDKETDFYTASQIVDQIENGGDYNTHEGENYIVSNDDTPAGMIIFFVIIFPIILMGIILTAVFKKKIKVDLSRAEKKDAYFRDNVTTEPNKMLGLLTQESLTSLQGTILYYFVKWVNDDLVELGKEEKERLFRKNKEIDVFYFKDPSKPMAYIEKIFYDFFLEEASFDGPSHLMKLTTDDLKKINYQDLDRKFSKYLKSDRAYEGIAQFIDQVKKKKFLNEEGKKHLLQYYGMKNFLKDFTLMDEREICEVKLWSYHLELAALLGLAEKVQEQLKVYPQVYQDTGVRMNPYTASVILHSVNSSLNTAMASSGSGGFSSTGGGGGFSGGGSGGGTR